MHQQTLIDKARQWSQVDPSPDHRRLLDRWIETANESALRRAFGTSVHFGTAGIRAEMGPGPALMNRVTVVAVARAIATFLKRQHGQRQPPVPIAFDARAQSRRFATDVAEVFVGQGLHPQLFDAAVPTPVLAFCAKESNAQCAVMVTASHNPPQYNGLKVYLGGGIQLIPPSDAEIAALVDWDSVRTHQFSEEAPKGVETSAADWIHRYSDAILTLHKKKTSVRCDLTIAYTALHGVGGEITQRLLNRAGHKNVLPVVKQQQPDAAFPTVNFPNPEERTALTMVMELGTSRQANLLLAQDPDADRLAVAEPQNETYFVFDGNQMGCLFADYLLRKHQIVRGKTPLVISTVVSSPLVGKIAKSHGAHWVQTLTGHKWIHHKAMALAEQYDFVFGYEEAIGYACGALVRDKDGISAALIAANMASDYRAEGSSLFGRLAELYLEHGTYVSAQRTISFFGVDPQSEMAAWMNRLRTTSLQYFGRVQIKGFRDLLDVREDSAHLPDALPPANLLIWDLQGERRLVARPSGTEPKIKLYWDARYQQDEIDIVAARNQAEQELEEVVRQLDAG